MCYDVTIIGGGVIGGLIARALTRYRLSVCILESQDDVAMGTSKANSAIVHAGFDAEPGTLKAKLNVEGNGQMEKVCGALSVPFLRNQSMVLGFDDADLEEIRHLYQKGVKNGVPGIRTLSGDEARELEPALSKAVKGALLAPSGGIVCPYELTVGAIENAMDNGCGLKTGFAVQKAEKTEIGWKLTSEIGEAIMTKLVVNAAGIHGDEIAALFGDTQYEIFPRRGEYMLLDKTQGKTVSRTIFQTPSVMGKGILVTPTVDGNLLLGPTSVNQNNKEDTATTLEGLEKIGSIAKKSVPDLNLRAVITSFTGLRACPTGGDFILERSERSGVFHAIGIESPGLSAAPAIAEYVVDLLRQSGISLQEREDFNPNRRPFPKFREMNDEERAELINKDSRFGRVICRCETVTEGEIVEALHRNPPVKDLDGIKRRTRTGMGRCQGGFCTPQVIEIMARELEIPMDEVTKFGGNSRLLFGKTNKGGKSQ